MKRREVLTSLASLPVLGLFAYGLLRKRGVENRMYADIPGLEFLGERNIPVVKNADAGELRIGIIGFGGRGHYLARALGFAHPDWIKAAREKKQLNSHDMTYDFFMEQENLNVRITGICDVYEPNAESGVVVSHSKEGPGGSIPDLKPARRYAHYHEMLASDDIDAVIIATPDHWHATMAMDAARAGKHVYLEKPMAQTEQEVHDMVKVIRESGIVFQLGHQNHQVDTHIKARKLVDHGFLGKMTLIQGTFNRYRAPSVPRNRVLTSRNINWEDWQGPAPSRVPLSVDRFFNWYYYFDYSQGQFGQLFCHEYAAINQVAGIGIPASITSVGGNYVWYRDRYEVPNVFAVNCDYPEQELLLNFSLTLGNAMMRRRLFMGTDATMQVDAGLRVWPELNSEKYRNIEMVKNLPEGEPMIHYQGGKQVDGISSATSRSFENKGIHNMWIDGKVINTAHLHLVDWINCIRNGGTPRCHIQLGFEEAITIIMAATSYREKRKVEWDPHHQRIV